MGQLPLSRVVFLVRYITHNSWYQTNPFKKDTHNTWYHCNIDEMLEYKFAMVFGPSQALWNHWTVESERTLPHGKWSIRGLQESRSRSKTETKCNVI